MRKKKIISAFLIFALITLPLPEYRSFAEEAVLSGDSLSADTVLSGNSLSEDAVVSECVDASENAVSGEIIPEKEEISEDALDPASPDETVSTDSVSADKEVSEAGINEPKSSISISFDEISVPVGLKLNLRKYYLDDGDPEDEYSRIRFTITEGRNHAAINGYNFIAKGPGHVTVKGTYICNGSFNTDYYRFDIFAAGFSKKGITIKEKCTIDASEIWKGDLLEHPAAWMSSCDPVASVDPQSGKITVKAAGTAVIYACFAFGEDQAKVYRFVIRAAKIGGLRCYSKTLKYGAVFSTKVINTDKDTAITWFLDGDEDRADFVDKEKGIIKLNSMIYDDEPLLLHAQAGEEVYTCTLSCKQPVLKGVPKDYDEKDYVLLRKGRTRQLSVKNIAKGVNVDWSSTDTDVVTVSRTGKVRAKGYGDATVKVKVAGYNDDDIDAYSIGFWVPDPKPDYDW